MVGDDEPPRLTITVGAPARYEARDFMLHLHARVCRAILDHLMVREDEYHTSAEQQRWQRLRHQARRRENGTTLARRLWRGLRWAVPLLLWYRDLTSAVADYVADMQLIQVKAENNAGPPDCPSHHLLAFITSGLSMNLDRVID